MHPSRVFIVLSLSFVLGVFIASFFSVPANVMFVLFSLGVFLVALSWRKIPLLKDKKLIPLVAGFALVVAVMGIWRFQSVSYSMRGLSEIAASLAEVKQTSGKPKVTITILGYVAEPTRVHNGKRNIIVGARQLISGNHAISLNEKVLVISDTYPEYKFGQTISVDGVPLLPGFIEGFDYKSYLAKDGIYTTMSFPEISVINNQAGIPFPDKVKISVLKPIYAVRNVFENSITRSISEPNASFVGGTLLGGRVFENETLTNDFKRTGTSHILAVSGYNITIIAEFFLFIFLAVLGRKRAMLFSIIGIAVFSIFVGAAASVIRAAIMGVLVLIARRNGRLSSPGTAIIGAAAVMVLIQPLILRYDVGFQLSFLATLGLVYISPLIEKYFLWAPSVYNFRETLAMTISAQMAVLPLIIFSFGSFSLISVPVNAIILPLIPVIMIMGFATGVLGIIIPFLGKILGSLSWVVSEFVIKVIKIGGSIPGGNVTVKIPWQAVFVFYLAAVVVLFLSWRGKPPVPENE
ncbi:MAG: competence protein ComEC [Parcubacteria group bacterium Licking1014_17]|nr:MAG: competence protein ComEC [Parcubacteria group bacterium Licking1014_17]